MNKSSKISEAHRPLLNLSEKIELKKVKNMLLYQILAYTICGKV